jgi:hypothetical protein
MLEGGVHGLHVVSIPAFIEESEEDHKPLNKNGRYSNWVPSKYWSRALPVGLQQLAWCVFLAWEELIAEKSVSEQLCVRCEEMRLGRGCFEAVILVNPTKNAQCLHLKELAPEFRVLYSRLVQVEFAVQNCSVCRSRWPLDLSRRPVTTLLLGLRIRIPPGAWLSASCECCVSGRRANISSRGVLPSVYYWVWSGATITLYANNEWVEEVVLRKEERKSSVFHIGEYIDTASLETVAYRPSFLWSWTCLVLEYSFLIEHNWSYSVRNVVLCLGKGAAD